MLKNALFVVALWAAGLGCGVFMMSLAKALAQLFQ